MAKKKKKPIKDQEYRKKLEELDDEMAETSPDEKPRTELDQITEGTDPMEMEDNTERLFDDAMEFAPKDGDLADDESLDTGDMPPELRKKGHHYEPGVTAGYPTKKEKDELEQGIKPESETEAGISHEEDSYTQEWEEEKEGGKKPGRKSRYENKD